MSKRKQNKTKLTRIDAELTSKFLSNAGAADAPSDCYPVSSSHVFNQRVHRNVTTSLTAPHHYSSTVFNQDNYQSYV